LLDSDVKLELQHFFTELSRARESALMLDYDGTLSPFQLERDKAYPYPGVPLLLSEIINTGHTRVVVISGRPAHQVVSLLGIEPHPEIWGAHGLQRLRNNGHELCELPNLDETTTQALAEADKWVERMGLHHLAEHKPGSLAVHWRGLPAKQQSDIRKVVLRGWRPVADRGGMLVQEFDGGLEMRLPHRNKGDAVLSILSEMPADTTAAYLGDDETDEDAFRALDDRGLRVLVRPQWRETSATVWLQPPSELQEFLGDWLQACRSAQWPELRRTW